MSVATIRTGGLGADPDYEVQIPISGDEPVTVGPTVAETAIAWGLRPGSAVLIRHGTDSDDAAQFEYRSNHATVRVIRLLIRATVLLQHLAPSCPPEILAEAVIRLGGYWHGDTDYGAVRSVVHSPEDPVSATLDVREMMGDRMVFPATHAAAVRNSGALAIIKPWSTRRGVAV